MTRLFQRSFLVFIDGLLQRSEPSTSPLVLRSDGGSPNPADSAAKRHRILRALWEQLERHPAMRNAYGIPEGQYAELRAAVDPTYIGREAEHATVRVTWQPNPSFSSRDSIEDRNRTSITANFAIHCSESSGFDCGWHLEPNLHVNGYLHYQERTGE